MTYIPQPQSGSRAIRVRPAEITAAVLRCQNGGRTKGRLEIVSLTGGLLWLPRLMDRGSRVKLMFMTTAGPVLSAAEMLRPVSWSQQPFRFVELQLDDQRRLQAITQPWTIEKSTAPHQHDRPRLRTATPPSIGQISGRTLPQYDARGLRAVAPPPTSEKKGITPRQGVPRRPPAVAPPSVDKSGGEEDWIEKYRAALAKQSPPRKRFFKTLLGAVTIATLGLGSAAYVFAGHLLK